MLAGTGSPQDDYSFNLLLGFVRAGRDSQTKLDAWNLAMQGLRAPISPEALASSPVYGFMADLSTRRVLQRLWLDAPAARGTFTQDPRPDALLTPAVLEQLRAVLLNVDGVRSPETRRVAVDVLRKLQSYEALAILQEAHAALVVSLPSLSGNARLAAGDLARRIDRAMSPYFS